MGFRKIRTYVNEEKLQRSAQGNQRFFKEPEKELDSMHHHDAINLIFKKTKQDNIIQPKLMMGGASDSFEREADGIAESVVNMPEGNLQNNKAVSVPAPSVSSVQTADSYTPVSPETESRIYSMKGAGNSLSQPIRDYYEQRFGKDFASVRVHINRRAEELNRSINARAFTVGKNIFFGKDEYNPGSKEGKKLIAHELSHVLQQQRDLRTKMAVIQRRPRRTVISRSDEISQGIRVLAVKGNYNKTKEKVKNTLSGLGYKTNAEIALETLVYKKGGKLKVLEFHDGTTISVSGAGLKLKCKSEVIQLKGNTDFKILLKIAKIIGRFSSFGNIDKCPSLDLLLKSNVKYFYKAGIFTGGSKTAKNIRGGYSFKFKITKQGWAGDSERVDPNGVRFTYYNYSRMTSTNNPDSYIGRYGRREASSWLNNQLNCIYTSKVNMLKSVGLIRPDLTVYGANRELKALNRNVGRSVLADYKMLGLAKKTDWAKLTGAAKYNFYWKAYSSLNSRAAETHFNNNGIFITKAFHGISHIFNIVGKIRSGVHKDFYKNNDPLNGTIGDVAPNKSKAGTTYYYPIGFAYALIRR
ncbi:MAG: DUF4157 domain-containing protein [bacterium]|nr:DUF4157 domain-containing protein [bacterium]